MLLASLLLSVLISSIVVRSDVPVPKAWKMKMARAATFADLAHNFNIVYTSNATNHRSNEVKIYGASLLKRPSIASHDQMRSAADQEHDEKMQLLQDIKQGSDTCKLQKVCIPVETEREDNTLLFYPMCYDVMRCVGSCCNSENKCHPHTSKNVSRVVVELGYVGGGKFKLNRTFNITMEEHTSCSCYQCTNKNLCKPGLVIGPSCTCECPNQDEKVECTGDKTWKEDQCKCECPVVICPQGEVVDERTCTCISEVTHISSARVGASHAVNIEKLPKLESSSKRRT
ncbi:pvf-1 [Pristionchus pacificus]|uniref:Pvf-1 n=1 Tax=Pristionchus pacificus TaxID=54126 RepID=A0A2A6BAX5_PRIPA|nr:pvf-1 [Pristionchus pacificus]|eukprot:PDM63042.1 pvf-1 [Pristionchus pacificus]